MCMNTTGIDLFDQNVGMVCAKVRLRYSWISLVLIYLIKMWVWHVPKETPMLMDITGIDLFDLNVGIVCDKVTLRCSWISLALIYLIKI